MEDVAELNQKIKNREIQFENVRCICGGENDVLIARKDFFGIDQDSVLCMNCGLVRLNPRMTEENIVNFILLRNIGDVILAKTTKNPFKENTPLTKVITFMMKLVRL